MTEQIFVPPRFRRGIDRSDESVRESAEYSLEYLRRHLGLEGFDEVEMLDIGCGSKFTQHLLHNELPIERYVGIDVSKELVEFLQREVDDPRFEYHHLNAHNARYNPDGERLTERSLLPIGTENKFDLICLFSVFTHLEPHDYRAMLHVMRRYVKPDGRLFYSLFIDERTPGGRGLVDGLAAAGGDYAVGKTDRFRDLDPGDPLAYALYSRDYAFELIEGTGWEVVSLDPPTEHIQHHFTCRPV